MATRIDMFIRLVFSAAMFLLAVSCSSRLPPMTSPAAQPPSSTIGAAPAPPVTLPPETLTAAPPSGSLPAPTATPSAIVTLDDNGRTIALHPSGLFLLSLGNQYDWQITIDNLAVLRPVISQPTSDNQGLYQAAGQGEATLSAVGNPKCANAVPRCLLPSLLFRIHVQVAANSSLPTNTP